MGAQTLGKKHGLMDRLRHVRSSAVPAPAGSTRDGGHGGEEPPAACPPPQAEELGAPPRGRPPGGRARGPPPPTKARRDGALDVQELDTRLEQYARASGPPRRDRSAGGDDDGEPGGEGLRRVASAGSAGAASSDFQAFLREAEEDDRHDRGHGAPGRGRELQQQPPLNPFYSNGWAARSEPPEKLSEVEESGGEDGGCSSSSSGGEGSGSGGGLADGDKDAADAAPRMPPLPRANTDPCGVQQGGGGRHVQFTSGTGGAGARPGGRRGSGASCTQRLKSPPRPVRRQRSMMKVISDYIRLPRD